MGGRRGHGRDNTGWYGLAATTRFEPCPRSRTCPRPSPLSPVLTTALTSLDGQLKVMESISPLSSRPKYMPEGQGQGFGVEVWVNGTGL